LSKRASSPIRLSKPDGSAPSNRGAHYVGNMRLGTIWLRMPTLAGDWGRGRIGLSAIKRIVVQYGRHGARGAHRS
jgi:hypothetical protein